MSVFKASFMVCNALLVAFVLGHGLPPNLLSISFHPRVDRSASCRCSKYASILYLLLASVLAMTARALPRQPARSHL
jgi:hypothetical protein